MRQKHGKISDSFQGLEFHFYLGVNIVVTDPTLSQVQASQCKAYFITSV